MGRLRLGCAALILLGWLPWGQAQEPAKPNDDIKRILGGLKQQAEEQRKDDRRRALLLVQQAQTAERGGQLADAAGLAQKAERLFPESDEIRQYQKYLAQQQRLGRERAINQAVAQRRIEEALDRVDELLRGSQVTQAQKEQARDLADAVREALSQLASNAEVEKLRKAVERVLRDLKPREPEPMLEELPAPQRTDPASGPPAAQTGAPTPPPVAPPQLTNDSLRRALMQRVSLSWHSQPLDAALAELSQLAGVPIGLDPSLAPPGPAPQVRLNLRVHQATIERLLRLLGEMTGGAYMLADGQVVFTTKARALEFAISNKYGMPLIVAPEPLFPPPRSLSNKLQVLPPPAKLPEYLESGKAFREHMKELLEPANP